MKQGVFTTYVILGLGIAFAPGCGELGGLFGEEDDDNNENSQVEINTSLNLVATSSYSNQQSLSLAATEGNVVSTCGATYQAQDQAAGPAESVKVRLKSITLRSDLHGTTSDLFTSSDANGTELTLTNGTVDISGLTLNTTLIEETYNHLKFTFVNEGKIKGCITEKWKSNSETSGAECVASDITKNCEPIVEGTYTFCTKAAQDTFTVMSGGAYVGRATYQATAAEETTFPLNIREAYKGSPDRAANFEVDIRIPPLAIGAGAQKRTEEPAPGAEGEAAAPVEPTTVETNLELTILVDLNTFLRFEGNTRKDLGPSGKVWGTHNIAFFYTTYLPDVMTAFLGAPGTIEGYLVEHCSSPNDSEQLTKAWFTLMFDAANQLKAGTASVYDDSGYIVLKGNFTPSDDPKKPSKVNADGTVDLVKPDTDQNGKVTGFESVAGFKRLGLNETNSLPKTNMTLLPRNGQARAQATTEYKRLL